LTPNGYYRHGIPPLEKLRFLHSALFFALQQVFLELYLSFRLKPILLRRAALAGTRFPVGIGKMGDLFMPPFKFSGFDPAADASESNNFRLLFNLLFCC
jgi:hypothetical protein